MQQGLKRILAGVFASLVLPACSYQDATLTVPAPDFQSFELEVYPLLLRDCGFPACHGDSRRFFRIYGPGRTRLPAVGVEVFDYDPATPEEIKESYARARSMLKGVNGIEDSPLLRKPLATVAGGAGHAGEDGWGRNVYLSPQDPAHVKLREWAFSTPSASQPAAQDQTGAP